jgi:hypothetical protein
LIAACDTFRAGAVEQLRTHMRHLNSIHPPEKHGGRQMVQLYEKGYGNFVTLFKLKKAVSYIHSYYTYRERCCWNCLRSN